jgi:uncharacterized protein (TIGR03435 family)
MRSVKVCLRRGEGGHPSFEVATIKPSDPNDDHQGIHIKGHRVFIENQTMNGLITFAYPIEKQQIVGGQEWFSTDRFDIDGVSAVEGEPNEKQVQQMLQKLLADRFEMKFHHDKRELSCYAIAVLRTGSKLVTSKSDPNGPPVQPGSGHEDHQSIRFTNNSMADFALGIEFFVDRPVVDQTGLGGKFDITMEWTPDESRATEPNAPPGLFTAIQEQLGLKLEAKKAPVDVLVIDRIERRPSAN